MVAGSASAQVSATFAAAYEFRLDRLTYRFENPSRFDTVELVPHFFRQHYEVDNHWLLLALGYRPEPHRWVTQVGATAQVARYGDDFDTFFQPDGDVITSGTTGQVSMRSWRIDHRMGAYATGPVRVHIGYGYHRDRARFHDGLKSVLHTRPPSIEQTVVTTRETAVSEVHEVRVGLEVTASQRRWRAVWNVEAAPVTAARLSVRLPDKYPGRDLRFHASAMAATSSLSLERTRGPTVLGLRLQYTRTWSYRANASVRREAVALAGTLGRHRH